jgi:hypothetical protein
MSPCPPARRAAAQGDYTGQLVATTMYLASRRSLVGPGARMVAVRRSEAHRNGSSMVALTCNSGNSVLVS